jgi:hypothetical protein
LRRSDEHQASVAKKHKTVVHEVAFDDKLAPGAAVVEEAKPRLAGIWVLFIAAAMDSEQAIARGDDGSRMGKAPVWDQSSPFEGENYGASMGLAADEGKGRCKAEGDGMASRRTQRKGPWNSLEESPIGKADPCQHAVPSDHGGCIGKGPAVLDGGNERASSEHAFCFPRNSGRAMGTCTGA